MKCLDWFDRWRRHVRDARDLYEEKCQWKISGPAFKGELSVWMTRTQAVEYVKTHLGLRVAMVDDERHEILCEHEKGRKISDAD